MNDNSVELTNLIKIYPSGSPARPDVHALRGINLTIAAGEFFTLLGPSGCGKTTTLRLIAGFETPTSGEVAIQGKPMSTVPPYRRPVNTVFQNYALFPHMNVSENVGFGLRVSRAPRQEREQRVREALALVQLEALGDRRPSQLSGGQQQRVALARALVNRPALLLLDEPLGALDLKLRKAMQLELKQLQAQVGITFVYVTHDQEEALTMSDRIAVMNDGHVLQVGDPATLYEQPAAVFVADFIGESNFIPAVVAQRQGDDVHLHAGNAHFAARAAGGDLRSGQAVTFSIRPEKLNILPAAGDAARAPHLATLSGTVAEVVYLGTDTRFIVALDLGLEQAHNMVVRRQNSAAPAAVAQAALPEAPRKGDAVLVCWRPADGRILVN